MPVMRQSVTAQPTEQRSSARQGRLRRNTTAAALLAFALLALSRLLGLTHQSLWYDEGYTVALMIVPSFHQFWLQFGAFTTSEHLQPLYYLIMFAWSRLLGSSDFAVRLPSALFGIAAGIAVWNAIGSLAAGSPHRRTAQFTGVLALTLSSYSLYYAQEARPYALLQMLGFCLLAAWLKARSRPDLSRSNLSRRDLRHFNQARLWLALCCGCCMLASPFAVLLVACLALTELALLPSAQTSREPDRAHWWSTWWPAIATSSLVLFGYLALALKTMPTFIAHDVTEIRQPLWMNVGYTLYGIVYGTTLPPATSALRGAHKLHVALTWWPVILPALVVLGTLVLACALACAAMLRFEGTLPSRLATTTRVMLLTAILYVAVLFGFFGGVGHLNVLPRHASDLFALLFLLVAACAVAAFEPHPSHSQPRRTHLLLLAALAGWALINLVSIESYWRDPAARKDGYRETAAALHAYHVPEFVVSGQPMLLARYGSPVLDATSTGPAEVASYIQTHSAHAPEVILVFNAFRSFRWAGSTVTLEDAMRPYYSCQIVQQQANIQIDRCEAKPSS